MIKTYLEAYDTFVGRFISAVLSVVALAILLGSCPAKAQTTPKYSCKKLQTAFILATRGLPAGYKERAEELFLHSCKNGEIDQRVKANRGDRCTALSEVFATSVQRSCLMVGVDCSGDAAVVGNTIYEACDAARTTPPDPDMSI